MGTPPHRPGCGRTGAVNWDGPATDAFREEYRASLSPRYSGALHFAFTTTACLSAIAACVAFLRDVAPLEWLALPVTFLIANGVEYFGHKGPMHHKTRGLGLVFERHTMSHHRFFAAGRLQSDTRRDFAITLFPPVLLGFFFGAVAAPLALLAWLAFGRNVALLFGATALAYYLTYEWLHLSYHLPDSHWVRRLPFVPALSAHHRTHHDVALMTQKNFNITFPIFDALLGTRG